jgi:hypothetical protein
MSYNDTGIDENDEDYTSQTDRVSRHKVPHFFFVSLQIFRL